MLLDDVPRVAAINPLAQTLVRPQNADQLVRQIVLHPLVVVHHDRGADGERRHGKDRGNHRGGMRVPRIESQNGHCLVRKALEAAEHHLRLDRNGDRSSLLVLALELPLEGADSALDLDDRLDHICPAVRARDLLVASDSLELDRLFVDVVQAIHPGERRGTQVLVEVRIALCIEARAVHTDIAQDLLNVVEVLVEVDRTCQRDVSKVTLTLLVGVLAGRTDLARLDDTEACIEDAAGDWIGSLVGLVRRDFDNRTPQDLLRRRDPKLDTNHCIGHFLLYHW